MKKIWPFSFYFLYFVAFASLMPYFVLFYQGLGFSGAQIGILTGVPPLITLVAAPFWTSVADARRWHKLLMGFGIAFAVVSILVFQSVTSFLIALAIIILFNFFFSPVSSLADSATMHMLGDERAMYGRIRLGGTFGWGLFAPIAGALVQNYGLRAGFWCFSIAMFINFFVSQRFVHSSHESSAADAGGIRTLLTSRRWLNFLFLAFLGGIGSFSAASYLFPYMAELGASETTMGIALTIATITEVPVFFFGNRFVKKFGSYGLLILALLMFGIRSLLYAAASTPSMVLLIQVFGGTIFPMLWMAGVSYADENAPASLKSSAQGLFGAVTFGFGSALSGFISGLMLESIGGRAMFLVLGIIILVGLGMSEAIRRLFPEKAELPQAAVLPSDK